MRIAMIASEINPLCKSGGLADAVYSLSKELVVKGQEVVCILPFYKSVKDAAKIKVARVGSYEVNVGWRKQNATIYKAFHDGILYYLVDNEFYYGRDNLYGYYDDGERFAFFALASCGLFEFIGFKPDIIHVHDWQPGMIPCLVKEGRFPYIEKAKFILTIHNEAFLGYSDRYFLNDFYGLGDDLFDQGIVEFGGQLSTLKSGIVYADKVTTVSPTHAAELLTPMGGKGLDGVLAEKGQDFVGIVNGIDMAEWDPEHDPFITQNYNAKAFKQAKKACKSHLLSSFGMSETKGPVIGVVSRLTYQKGIDLVFSVIDAIVKHGVKLIVLGSGDRELEETFEALHREFPDSVGFYRGYSFQLAHDIYAGADFFLMPSLFEPCGIGQMIAQRYGCLPVVRKTGGLCDTVIGYDGTNEEVADGLSFYAYKHEDLYEVGRFAYGMYKDRALFTKLVRNAMLADHSWGKSCEAYLKLYKDALKK